MPEPTGYPDLDALLPRLDAIASLDSDALATEYTSVLGRKGGVLTAALRSVATIPVEQRKAYGAAVNRLKARFEEAFARRREAVDAESRQRDLAGTDLTMPGRRRWIGAEHPVTRVVDEIVDIFRGIGFTVAVGPEVETDWFNFTALNFPADHPAMDMHDTLYVDAPPVPGERLLKPRLEPIDGRAVRLPLLYRKRGDGTQRGGEPAALPAQHRGVFGGKRVRVQARNGVEPGQQGIEIGVTGGFGHLTLEPMGYGLLATL